MAVWRPWPVQRSAAGTGVGGAGFGPVFRAWLWRQMRTWHWVSSAVTLAGMLMFALTGITLNHAGEVQAKPKVEITRTMLPVDLLEELRRGQPAQAGKASGWFRRQLGFRFDHAQLEREGRQLSASLSRPGGDAWLTVDLDTGAVTMEKTHRGWIAVLNDLHKGRHTGRAWSVFLDVFSVSCLVFCLTGLGLLVLHAPRRPATYPAVALGVLIPALLAAWLLHL